MPQETRTVSPGVNDHTVIAESGETLQAPDDWELLPPGDAGMTRRVKAAGPSWTVREKRGRRVISRGVWAPSERIAAIRLQLTEERSTVAYAKKRAADAARREQKQSAYVEDFAAAVLAFLQFDSRYDALASQLAQAVTQHATPVGSGTVARTERIPIERRAESAVIAWLRHQTTAYDNMKIACVKGRRREVRRLLAEESRRLLATYRQGTSADEKTCPLQLALRKSSVAN